MTLDAFILFSKLLLTAPAVLIATASYFIHAKFHRLSYTATDHVKNVVVIGASFAGYHAAKRLANSLPSGYRVVVIEKKSHFHFTWVFPRFSVVPGHEHKAFIPYGPYLADAPHGSYLMLHDTVVEITKDSVRLQSGKEVRYEFLLMATGSTARPPSRLAAESKSAGILELQNLQRNIANAQNLVIIGGGAAGMELASDAKSFHPQANVTLIHSRKQLLHHFGPRLHEAALRCLTDLQVRVVLGERPSTECLENGYLTLSTGEKIDYDYLVECVGQKPASEIISPLIPDSISNSGHLKVRATLQVDNETFTNIYAAGDIVEIPGNRNSRAAMEQAQIAAGNIVNSILGKPLQEYSKKWWEEGIELTLGLGRSAYYMRDGQREALLTVKSKDVALKCQQCWKFMGASPYEDRYESLTT